MMKNPTMIFSIIGTSAFVLLAASASVEAKKIGDWTCYDFLKAPSSQKSSIVYFVQGMSLAEKKDELDLAAKSFGVPVSKVVQECQKDKSAPLWDKIVSYFNLP
jgi:hypothetical protein